MSWIDWGATNTTLWTCKPNSPCNDTHWNIAGKSKVWEPPSSFVPRYTTVWMDYLKKKHISLDVKDVLVGLVAAVGP